MSSFLKSASKQVTDVRNYLRDSAGGSSIKYTAEKGAKHIIYIPYSTTEQVDPDSGSTVVVKSIYAISGGVHEWTSQDGKFKAVVCMNGVVRSSDDGSVVINDGTCPICDRIGDAWDIYKYRKELEEASCKLVGDKRKEYMEKVTRSIADERKAKEIRNYMYILVVKFRMDEAGNPILGNDKLPEYELKVMKLSASRVEKIQQQVANSGSELPDSELIFEYPAVEDRRLLVSQSTTAPVFPNSRMVAKYPALINKINEDISKFEWDGIDKSFPEWAGMTTEAAKILMDSSFEQWDAYKKELTTNPQAKYLEYVVETPTTTPSIDGVGIEAAQGAPVPVVPGIPTMPGAGIPTPVIPNIPTPAPQAASAPTPAPVPVPQVAPAPAPQVPPAPAADPNAVFAGNGAAAPTITV